MMSMSDRAVFEVDGLDKLWAFRSRLEIPLTHIVNAEIDQRYWLPATQRTEFQTTLALLGRDRAVMRIVSKFGSYAVNDTSSAAISVNDSSHIPHRTTWARSDSVSHFTDWTAPLGQATTIVSAGDFDDVAPDAWKVSGSTKVELVVEAARRGGHPLQCIMEAA